MRITKQDIKEFIEFHFEVDNIFIKSQTYSIFRAYFYYLCYKYVTQVINSIELARFAGIKQHGTILNGLNNVANGMLYDKRIKIELSCLESEFLKKFKVGEDILQIQSYSELLLKRKLSNSIIENNKKRFLIQDLRYKIKTKNTQLSLYKKYSKIESIVNKKELSGNCAEQPFKITRYHETSTRNIENRI